MKRFSRQTLLKVAAAAVVGLLLLDRLVISPATEAWREQSVRMQELRELVRQGRQLAERSDSIRNRWTRIRGADLSGDLSRAGEEALQAVSRWANASGVRFSSLVPQWREHEEGFQTFEIRATATGSQAALGRLLYEIETDSLPVRLEECQIITQDERGNRLLANLRFSFVRLNLGPEEVTWQ